ncbi:hypothetical protein B0H11DRAFT_2232414 [Mycena galericulata]|nr:hypothetical protein B0H11DRAFT_2232414 [Mycena galericulata]
MSTGTLSYDLLCLVLDVLEDDDNSTLCQCSLVNREFNRAASRVLYSQVIFSPETTSTRQRDALPSVQQLSSAILSHNAPYVMVFRIGGYLSNALPETLLSAVKAFVNLNTLEILPETHPDDLFSAVLAELKSRTSLVTLRVNSACADEIRAPLLVDIGGLRELALKSPSRAILQLLPDWLTRLPTLRELHLTSNCGSITPGILRSFVPLLTHITAFSLGLSYSIADDDLFDFLAQLPCLETAQLQHYLALQQFKAPSDGAPLKRLRSLTVLHRVSPSDDDEDEDESRLCAWVLRAISGAPIQQIRLRSSDDFDDDMDTDSAPRAFDELLAHLAHENPRTLKTLDLGAFLVSAPALSALCTACGATLEELGFALDRASFESFASLLPTTLPRLHTAALKVYSPRQPFSVSVEDAARIMQSSAALRRLAVNGLRTEGSWVSDGDSVRFVVRVRESKAGQGDAQRINPEPQSPSMDRILEEEEEEE